MGQIFISYSRADKAFADQLRTDLEKRGVDVWIDVEDIPAGLKWSSAIQQALDSCTVMIVILSPEAAASKNVEDEWQYFLDQNKPLVPVLLRPTKTHFQISRIQYIDFSQQPYRAAFDELCAELQRKGVVFARRIPAPPPVKQKLPAASSSVPLPESYPYSAPARQPRRFLNCRWLLLMLLVLVGIVVGVLLWDRPDSALAPNQDDPADVVQVYFSAIESKNMDLLNEILCPGMFNDEIRAEYDRLFAERTYRMFDFEVREVAPIDDLSVHVIFSFRLEIEEANGAVRDVPTSQREFRIERRFSQPDEIWCSTSHLLDELHG